MKSVYKLIFALFVTASLISGCDKIKDFGDTNVDPNRTTEPNTSALRTNVMAGLGALPNGLQGGITVGGLWVQYFSETQYSDQSAYALPQFNFDNTTYAGPLYDLQNIINYCSDPLTAGKAAINGSTNNQIAIARILKAYIFWTVTDRWGDVPYSQALTIVNASPVYDAQFDIYKDLFKELKEANAQFTNGGIAVKGDIIYNSNITKWKKLANSLRMLMALRLQKKFPNIGDFAATEFDLAKKDPAGVIENNDDNFALTYVGGNYRHPFFDLYDARSDFGVTDRFYQIMDSVGLSDNRKAQFGSSGVGAPYGRNRNFIVGWASANPTYSRILNASQRTATSKLVFIPSSVIWLARAEAKQRIWTSASEAFTDKYLYDKGIEKSHEQWGVTLSPSYMSGANVDYDGTNPLKKIGIQTYLAWYPNGLQAWCEWRRTGIPSLRPAVDAANSSKLIPRRNVYGVNEYNTNNTNRAAAAALIPSPDGVLPAGDTQDGKVWWDR